VLTELGRQTAVREIEAIVIDHGGGARARSPAALERRTVVSDGSWGRGRALAVRAARAPWIAFIEDHAVPEPGWARALIQAAGRGRWAAIGYGFRCANPGSYRTRAAFMAEYGRWAVPLDGGTSRHLSGVNVAYDREVLLSLGAGLEEAIEIDIALQELLLARGLRFGIAPGAVVRHVEFERLRDLFAASFSLNRVVAARRGQVGRWSLARRLLYAAGSPLGAPLVNLSRLALSLRARPQLWLGFLTALPVTISLYAWAALGEAGGHLSFRAPADTVPRWELEQPRTPST
jgi:hypothetical protein